MATRDDKLLTDGIKDLQKNKAVRYKMLLDRITDAKKNNPDISYSALSERFGIHHSMISAILNGKHPQYYYDYYKLDKEE